MRDGKKLVLLVDDDPQVALILKAYVDKKEGILLSAGNVQDGFNLFEENSRDVDLVIIRVGLEKAMLFVQVLRDMRQYVGHIMAKSGLPIRREPFMVPGLCDRETSGPDLLPKLREALGWTE